jgi:hypothetical protein
MIAAGSIGEGADLLYYRDQSGISLFGARSQRNEDQRPLIVEDVFGALAKDVGSARITTSANEFHGDAFGFKGDVDVVGTYRELLRNREAVFSEHARNFILEQSLSTLTRAVGSGTRGSSFERVDAIARRFPGSGALTNARSAVHRAPLERLGFGPGSRNDVVRDQYTPDDVARDTILFRELVLGCSGDILVDKVIRVRKFNYEGHVFDLQSRTGILSASNIIVSNCRCVCDVSDEPPGWASDAEDL